MTRTSFDEQISNWLDDNIPEETKATIAHYYLMRKPSAAVDNMFLSATRAFIDILKQLSTFDKTKGPTREVELFSRLSVARGQHSLLITLTDEDAIKVAEKIFQHHKKGALLYNVSQKYIGDTTKEMNRPKAPVAMLRIPSDSPTRHNEKFDEDKATEVMNKTIPHLAKYGFVKGVTLTTTALLLGMARTYEKSFIEFEKRGTQIIANSEQHFGVPVSWLCVQSLEELGLGQRLEKLADSVVRNILVHNLFILMDNEGQMYYNQDAVERCYELIVRIFLGDISVTTGTNSTHS